MHLTAEVNCLNNEIGHLHNGDNNACLIRARFPIFIMLLEYTTYS